MAVLYQRQGFTLVELSIVLVVIGLIVGGVLTGVDMIKGAQLRAVIKEMEEYKTAIYAFKNKYGEYPGDFRGAYAIWGAAAGCTNNWVIGVPTGCNGDGNGIVDNNSGSLREDFRGWQHLALAELISGSYTGVTAPAGAIAVIDLNIPHTKINNGGYYYTDHLITFGAQLLNNKPDGQILSPQGAWEIDRKMDDGVSNRGIAQAYNAADSSAPNYCASSGNYLVATSNNGCRMQFSW